MRILHLCKSIDFSIDVEAVLKPFGVDLELKTDLNKALDEYTHDPFSWDIILMDESILKGQDLEPSQILNEIFSANPEAIICGQTNDPVLMAEMIVAGIKVRIHKTVDDKELHMLYLKLHDLILRYKN